MSFFAVFFVLFIPFKISKKASKIDQHHVGKYNWLSWLSVSDALYLIIWIGHWVFSLACEQLQPNTSLFQKPLLPKRFFFQRDSFVCCLMPFESLVVFLHFSIWTRLFHCVLSWLLHVLLEWIMLKLSHELALMNLLFSDWTENFRAFFCHSDCNSTVEQPVKSRCNSLNRVHVTGCPDAVTVADGGKQRGKTEFKMKNQRIPRGRLSNIRVFVF